MAKGVKGLWVRGGTEFVLNDAQYAGRSDAAQALFWWFGAQVLKHHGEFLPLDYSDPKMIARLRGRTAGTMRKAIDELAAPMPRPLVAKMPDGRLRVLGQREKHGDKIGWVDERADAAAWNAANPDDVVRVESFAEHVPQGKARSRATLKSDSEVVSHPEPTQKNFSQNADGGQSQDAPVDHVTESAPERSLPVRDTNGQRTRTDVDVDLDVKGSGKSARRTRRKANGGPSNSDADTANGITAPDGVAADDWWRLLRMTVGWSDVGKGGGLKRLAAILRANGPADAEAWINKAARGQKSGGIKLGPWSVLGRGFTPSDSDRDGEVKKRPRGSPERVGAILGDGNGKGTTR